MHESAPDQRTDIAARIRKLLRSTRELDRTQRRWRKAAIAWLRQVGRTSPYAAFDVEAALQACPQQPTYSLILPIAAGDRALLSRCLESIQRQLYTRWELIAVPIGPPSPALASELDRWMARDARIRKGPRLASPESAAAVNQAIWQSTGEFVGFLEPQDELPPDALLWMAVTLNRHPRSRWFYTDEATLDDFGNFAGRVQRKPAFSWEYLLATDYASRFAIYDRQLLVEAGGIGPECRDAQQHDLTLRLSEIVPANEVTHIPQLLFFRRAIPRTELPPGDDRATIRAAHQAISRAAERRALNCRVASDPADGTRFQVELLPDPHRRPKVAIVIPTYNAAFMLRRCIESLAANTAYPNYEIVVIDNRSNEPELADYLAELAAGGRGQRIAYPKPFNHSDMHNEAIAQLDAEMIVMLNNDVFAFSPGWLEQLVATLELDSAIAGVGAKLLYPDGTIQHAGMVIGSYRGLASNVGGGAPGNSAGYFGRHRALQQVSGVTAAMMIVRRSAYLAVGGFNAQRYPTSYNDVDLWLRLGDAGFRCLFNPAVQATHEESKTRGVSEQEFEFRRRLQADLQRRGWRDPFWNLALFENPDDLLRKEKSGTWILEKMQDLRQQVELLRGSISDAGSASPVPASHRAGSRNAAASRANARIHND